MIILLKYFYKLNKILFKIPMTYLEELKKSESAYETIKDPEQEKLF